MTGSVVRKQYGLFGRRFGHHVARDESGRLRFCCREKRQHRVLVRGPDARTQLPLPVDNTTGENSQ